MNMNQQRVIVGGVVIFLLMMLFPPWLETTYVSERLNVEGGTITNHSETSAAGYHFIFASPKGRTGTDYRADERISSGYQIDITRLAIQWIAIIILTWGFYWVLGDKKRGFSLLGENSIFNLFGGVISFLSG